MLLFAIYLHSNFNNILFQKTFLVMAKAQTKDIKLKFYRNIGIIAHVDAGKTTTTERILFYTGKKHKLGEVHEGQAEMDFMEQEQERGITIQSAATTAYWTFADVEHRINIIDTPGHVDFTAEVERSLRVLDGAITVFDGKQGVEPQSSKVWFQAAKYNVPRLCFINKLDAVGGDFYMSLESIQKELDDNAVAIQIPIGEANDFEGLIDLVEEKAYIYKDELGKDIQITDIPENMKAKAGEYREKLLEAASEVDDDFAMKYLEGEEITVEDLNNAIRKGVLSNTLFPVLGGSALANKGVQVLLDNVCKFLPSPLDVPAIKGTLPENEEEIIERKADSDEPFSGLVFKIAMDPHVGSLAFCRIYSGTLEAGTYVYNSATDERERVGRLILMHANSREELDSARAGDIVAIVGFKNTQTGHTICDENNKVLLESIEFPEPVVQYAIEPQTKSDQEKMGMALKKLTDEDPTLRISTDKETGQTIISGMGELHLEVKVDILKREYKIDVATGKPQVAYREAIEATAEHRELLKKQSGGAGQFADATIILEPNERGEGYEFIDEIKGGAIPREFIPSVDKGIKAALESGVIGGYPVVDVKVRLIDGSYHEVDSNTDTFRIVGTKAFKEAMRKASPILLEPIMKVVVSTPPDYAGEVTGALSSKRGQIKGMETKGKMQEIHSEVPIGNLFGWTSELRSMTKGKASSVLEFSHYAKVPQNLVSEIVEGK
jgi:elongation factor G